MFTSLFLVGSLLSPCNVLWNVPQLKCLYINMRRYLLRELKVCLRTEKSGQTPCLEQTIFVFTVDWWLFKITQGGGACCSNSTLGELLCNVYSGPMVLSAARHQPHGAPTPPPTSAHCVQTLETVHLLYFWWSLSKVQTVIYCCSITSAHSYNDYSLSSLSLSLLGFQWSRSLTHTHGWT